MTASAPTLAPDPLTLEQVKEQFSLWRTTRPKRGKIPDDLLEAVGRLMQQQTYSDRYIAAELGLNYQQLKLRLRQNLKKSGISLPPSGFVELPLSSLSPVSQLSSLSPLAPSLEQRIFYPSTGTIEFTRSDGTALKASGLNPKDLCALVQSFLGK